mgnify:CR=1 FL=1
MTKNVYNEKKVKDEGAVRMSDVYATFGDLVPHVHVHVVPKYKDGPDWGNPFDDTQGKKELTDAEYQKMVDELKETILKELNK